MKNLVYVVVIGACVLVAAVVFVKTRSGNAGGINSLSDEMTWVKCAQCGQSYQMSLKEFYKEEEAKAKANPTPMPIAHPLTCQKCGKDAVRKAFKCEKCGEVSFTGSVPNDFEDRCPKCKYSAQEARRKARLGQK